MRSLLTSLIVLLLLPVVAQASPGQKSLFQDDNSLIYSGDATRDKSLDELDALGVDVIRTNLLWSQVAAGANSRARPAGDPYATAGWDRWDALVAGARARGIAVQITLTGPLPLWASPCGGAARVRRTCKPSVSEYGRFVAAAAKRYPQVNRWSLWNEPNQAGWLYPANEAPWRYRQLATEGIKRLRANGHANHQILLGETAPLGRRTGSLAKRSLAPGTFLSRLLCVGHQPRSARCKRRMPKLRVSGFAHHPYTRGAGKDPRGRVGSGDITLPQLGRLGKLLDRSRMVGNRLPIYLTEYGFQTNPPDRLAGVSPSKAAEWLNESDWMAYNMSRVRTVAQYELFDERDRGAFQTGLRYLNGRAKPGLAAYRLPIWVVRRHGRTTVWGQARAGGTSDRIEIRYQKRRGSSWRKVQTVRPNSHGFIRRKFSRAGYRWRLYWRDATGHQHAASRAARPDSR